MNGDCPCCGHSTWLPLPEGRRVELRLSQGEGVLPSVAAFGCGQCGFIRLHVDPATGFDLANPPAVEALRPRARTSPT